MCKGYILSPPDIIHLENGIFIVELKTALVKQPLLFRRGIADDLIIISNSSL